MGWTTSAACILAFAFIMVVLMRLVSGSSQAADKSQRKVLLENGSVRFEDFVDAILQEVRAALMSNKDLLWSWPMQCVLRESALRIVPQIRPWSDDTQGQEYLEDLET